MYSSRPTYGSPQPELSNNPFIDHSANAMARYPDITGSDDPTTSQYTSWLNRPSTSALNTNTTGYFGQNQGPVSPQGYSGGYQQQQQQQPQQATGWGQGQGSGFGQPQQSYAQSFSPQPQPQPQMSGMPFQPTSSFGQQLSAHQQQQYPGYADMQSPQYGPGQGYQQGFPAQQAQPQMQQRPSYLAEFDPGMPQIPAGSRAGSGMRGPHPREYVQSHKAELESWDSYSWKQVDNCLDGLKHAWEARKGELEARMKAMGGAGLFGAGSYGGIYGGGPAQQYAQLENMVKEAVMHIDTIAASSFQMQEVFSGYRHSNDIASKRRVREAINAALTSLPDWPQPMMF
ncbi:hypothetical protein C8Q80DRAFT_1163858 [Daedaleopsis nitida]|nr:hypothetical protein C8Q80DRAFT_1163858 [Daedaleopsis nitida]